MSQQHEFAGMRIIESANCTEAGAPVCRVRPWRERLFRRPWRPWIAVDWYTPQVPSKQAFQIGPGTILMHPAAARALKISLGERRP